MRIRRAFPPRSVAVRYWCNTCRRKTRFIEDKLLVEFKAEGILEGSPTACIECGRQYRMPDDDVVICGTCGDVFKNSVAFQGHQGGYAKGGEIHSA